MADQAVAEFDAARWIEFAKANLRWEFAASAIAIIAAIITCWLLPRFLSRFRPLIVAMIVVMDLGYFNLRCIQFEGDSSVQLTDANVAAIGTQRLLSMGTPDFQARRCDTADVLLRQ